MRTHRLSKDCEEASPNPRSSLERGLGFNDDEFAEFILLPFVCLFSCKGQYLKRKPLVHGLGMTLFYVYDG